MGDDPATLKVVEGLTFDAAFSPDLWVSLTCGGTPFAVYMNQAQLLTKGAGTGGYLGTEDFLTFIRNAEAGIKEQGLFEGRGPIAILLLVLVGGLALNLTPCVLPMIPILSGIIVGAGRGQPVSRGRAFSLSLAYPSNPECCAQQYKRKSLAS